MKRIFLCVPILVAVYASAQEPYHDFKKFKENWNASPNVPFDNGFRKDGISKDSLENLLKNLESKKYASDLGRLAMSLPNGTNVYLLPRDNMPCMVPDLSRTNYNMPILMKGLKITGMPPGSAPSQIIPNTKTNKKPLQ